MSISERIFSTIEDWQATWKERLKGWLVSVLSFGLEVFMDILGKAFAPKLKPLIDSMEESGEVPPELKPLLDEMKTPTGQVAAMLGWTAGGAIVGGAIGKITDALFSRFGYWISSKFHPLILAEPQYLALWRRGNIKADELVPYLRKLGFDDDAILHLQKLSELRLDPMTVTAIWLRDKAKYEKYWRDLFDTGWTTERIEIAKELAKVIPPLADMVRFADFSAFDPEVIAKWREFYDAPGWITEPMSLIGIENEAPRDWANKYWFSHWIQPGRYELGEIYRRGLLGEPLIGAEELDGPRGDGDAEKAVKLAYRTMGYSAYWQEHLLQLVREIPTRVDIRRWWDMRTIDEDELRSLYQRQGYFGKDLENYVLWTKVYVAFPDLMARWSNGWITEGDVRAELTALGMPAERVDEMIQTKKKAVEAAQVEEGKALTKTEIYKGVKKATLTRDEGIDLLMDLNYTLAQAEYLLDVNVGALEGSPETYDELKDITTKYKIAIGKEAKPMPEELKKAGEELVRLTKELALIKEAVKAEERGLVEEEVLPEAATAKLDELRVTLHRAEAELNRVKTEYDGLVAQWRYGE